MKEIIIVKSYWAWYHLLQTKKQLTSLNTLSTTGVWLIYKHIILCTWKPLCVHACKRNFSSPHLFFHCHFYIPIRATLFDKLKEIVNNLQELSDQTATEMLLYGSLNLTHNQNSQILNCTIKYIMDSKRFTGSLF